MLKLIKLEKIAVVKNPAVETARWHEYNLGSGDNEKSPPVEYWITGYINEIPQIGKSISVGRTSRNGVDITGLFHSSPIAKIKKINDKKSLLFTRNSVYCIEYID